LGKRTSTNSKSIKKTLTLSAIITSVILLSGISGFVLSNPDAFALDAPCNAGGDLTQEDCDLGTTACETACNAAVTVMTAACTFTTLCEGFQADRIADCDQHLPVFRDNFFLIGMPYEFSYQACINDIVPAPVPEPEGKDNPCDALDKASQKGSEKGKDKKAKGIEKAKNNNDC